MYGFTPLALGSYWALVGSFFLILITIARIYSEEKFLAQNLDGYKDYLQKVRYRVIPWIW
jgi:protein-S-isoprenylcysteine O-methyltransferase Ste14